MSRLYIFLGLIVCGLLVASARAETFKLTTGETVTGELLVATAGDQGVQVKVGEGEYKRIPWSSFTQEDIKNFAKNPKIEPFVEPFIEVSQAEKIKKTEVHVKEPPHPQRLPKQSLFGAMFSSTIGLFVLFMIYGATIYAGYEVAIFRARPTWLVAGLAAIPVLGIISPIVFLSMPTRMQAAEAPVEEAPPEAAAAGATAVAGEASGQSDDNPMHVDGAQKSALHLAAGDKPKEKAESTPSAKFQRGQFTFNRRFFETKFPGFFGVVRRDVEPDMVLVFKTARGEYAGERITRIAAADLHLQVRHGQATEEILIPFQEIKEVELKHKGA